MRQDTERRSKDRGDHRRDDRPPGHGRDDRGPGYRRDHVSRLGCEVGWTTAELLGNAALGILALVAIWALLQSLGVNVVQWIGAQLGVG